MRESKQAIALLKLQPSSTMPLSRQIHDQIAAAIAAGRLVPGDRLPSVRALALAVGINPMTAAKAYRSLAAARLVSSQRGGGTHVADATPPRSEPAGQQPANASAAGAVSVSQRLFELARAPGIIAFTGNYPRPEDCDVAGFCQALAALAGSKESADYFRYDPPGGRPELQEQIARFVGELGISMRADNVVVTSGGQQAIDLVIRAAVPRGGVVICESPAYFGVLNALRAAHAQIVTVPVERDGMDVGALEQALSRHRARLIYTNPTFHNPTGASMSLQKRLYLLDLARRHRVPILEDDHCPELRFRGEPLPPLRALCAPDDEVFYARGFGKAYVPGIRLGFLLAAGRLRSRLLELKALTDLQSNAFMQGALAAYLAQGRHRPAALRTAQIYGERQDILYRALSEHIPEEATIERPDGGLSLWLRLPPDVVTSELYFEAVRHGITCIGGDVFHATEQASLSLRISFGLNHPDELVRGSERLGALLRALVRPSARAAIFV